MITYGVFTKPRDTDTSKIWLMDVRSYVTTAEMRARRDGHSDVAIDLGFGTETVPVYFLKRGWQVIAIDIDPAAVEKLQANVPTELRHALIVRCANFCTLQLPPCKLINAGYALQYVLPAGFREFWENMTESLVPGGVFAGHFFGKNDLFARHPQRFKTFSARELKELLRGWNTFVWEEYQGRGQRDLNRQWHFYTVCAQKSSGQ